MEEALRSNKSNFLDTAGQHVAQLQQHLNQQHRSTSSPSKPSSQSPIKPLTAVAPTTTQHLQQKQELKNQLQQNLFMQQHQQPMVRQSPYASPLFSMTDQFHPGNFLQVDSSILSKSPTSLMSQSGLGSNKSTFHASYPFYQGVGSVNGFAGINQVPSYHQTNYAPCMSSNLFQTNNTNNNQSASGYAINGPRLSGKQFFQ